LPERIADGVSIPAFLRLILPLSQANQTEEIKMKKINLKTEYPNAYTCDYFCEVEDSVADALDAFCKYRFLRATLSEIVEPLQREVLSQFVALA
jgi:hypothetical protein